MRDRAPGTPFFLFGPIAGAEHDLPEPDVAVVRGEVEDYRRRHPGGEDILLVVEVARTSQTFDRAKAATYARAGIETYWLLDLPAYRLEVFSEPTSEGRYKQNRVFEAGQAVPIPETDVELPVASLFS